MKLEIGIAVVDEGGHLLAFARMDNAPKQAVRQALDVAGKKAESDYGKKFDGELRLATPVIVEKQRVGYIGLGGVDADQDGAITRAATQALLDALKKEE